MSTPQLALPMDVNDDGETRTYKIRLPFLPPSKNQINGYPYEWRSGIKGKWIRRIVAECEAQQIPKGNRQIGLAAVLVFPNRNRRDPSNYSQELWNYVPDALQAAGVLLDDRDGAIVYGPNLGVKFAVDDRPRLPKEKRRRTIVAVTIRVEAT